MQGAPGRQDDDELSFRDFTQQLRQLRSFLRGLAGLLSRYLRQYWLVILLLLAGAAAWAVYGYRNGKVYEARASFVYIELQKKTYGEMMDKLQEMLRRGSYRQAARALGLTENQVRQVLDLKGENMHGARLSEDITENKKVFYITAVAGNNAVFDSLQPALERYLNNNVLVREMVSRRKKVLEQKIRYHKSELAMLDSLKLAYTKSLEKPLTAVYAGNSSFNPVALYDKSEQLNQEIADMQVLLDDYRPVQTQDGFMVTETPNGKALPYYLARSLAAWLLASVLVIVCLSICRK